MTKKAKKKRAPWRIRAWAAVASWGIYSDSVRQSRHEVVAWIEKHPGCGRVASIFITRARAKR